MARENSSIIIAPLRPAKAPPTAIRIPISRAIKTVVFSVFILISPYRILYFS